MANKRTVDPTGQEPSAQIVGVRLGRKHMEWIAELGERNGMSRSVLIRHLIERAARDLYEPEPF